MKERIYDIVKNISLVCRTHEIRSNALRTSIVQHAISLKRLVSVHSSAIEFSSSVTTEWLNTDLIVRTV
jgi:hypothetical protein